MNGQVINVLYVKVIEMVFKSGVQVDDCIGIGILSICYVFFYYMFIGGIVLFIFGKVVNFKLLFVEFEWYLKGMGNI